MDGDSGPLYAAARAIVRLQTMFGLIPRIQASCAPPLGVANTATASLSKPVYLSV